MVRNEPKATIEEWRPTHHPHYDVSNLGRVRSRARGGLRVLRQGRSSSGYWSVSFGRGHGSQSIHVLVAAAFLGPCPEGQECRHKDDDRTNAKADNLEYGTRRDNVQDMMQRGRHNPPSKLTLGEVQIIRRALDSSRCGPSRRVAAGFLTVMAECFNVSVGTIKAISTRRRWKDA